MSFFWTKSARSLNNIHQEVKETCTWREFQKANLKKQQFITLEKIIKLQENMCLNYIQKCQEAADLDTSLKQFYYTNKDLSIRTDFASLGIDKQVLDEFIMHLSKNLSTFASTVQYDKFVSGLALKFIPFDFNPLHYALFSALPSLFGYCWSSELAESYIDFLFNSAFTNRTFSLLHLTLSLSNFIRVSIGPVFFKKTMGNELLDLILPLKVTDQDIQNAALTITNNMLQNITLIPRHVRRIIRRFFNIDENKLMTAESFVRECLVNAAIKNPKEYGIIDFSIYLSQNIFTRLNNLCHTFQFAASGDSISDLHSAFVDFVSECENVDEIPDLPLVSHILPLLKMSDFPMVQSLTDAVTLAYLVLNSDCHPKLKQLAEIIFENKKYPFCFFQVVLKDLSQFQITTSDANNMDTDNSSQTTKTIFNFFEQAPVCETAPNNFIEFLNFHRRKADLEHKEDHQIILQRILSLLPKQGSREWADIIPSLEDELERQKLYATLEEESLSKLSLLGTSIDSMIKRLKSISSNPHNAFYYNLFEEFLDANQDIKGNFESRSIEYFQSLSKFYSVFESYCSRIRAVIADDEAYTNVLICFHTYIMTYLPIDMYIAFNPQFKKNDDFLSHPPEKMVQELCIAPSAEKVRKLFDNTEIFSLAIAEISEARIIPIPVIALGHLNEAIYILNTLFFMEYGSGAQADELTPIIVYLILKCRIPNMYSFVMYLKDFLLNLCTKQFMIIKESNIVGLTHIINHVTSIFEAIPDIQEKKIK